ncbi:MFS transporter [Marinomonas sp. 5E14-1]|uniref:MFS transporter n=1 Tax=Marinomonas sp. 5E14-1 TaxID=3153922 RepID=UPI003264B6E4
MQYLKKLSSVFDISALKQAQYRHYFFASLFSTLAVWMGRFMFGWLVWEITESFFWVGIVSFVLLIPTLFVTPFFGVVSDRVDLRNGLLVWLSMQSFLAFITFALYLFISPSVFSLLVIAFVFGCVASAGSPLRLSLIPRLVDKETLPNAVGLGAILFNLSRVVAPAIAAALLTLIKPEYIFLISAIFFLCAVLFNVRLKSMLPTPPETKQSKFKDFIKGFSFAYQSKFILLMLMMTLINSQVGRALIELLPALSGTFTKGQPHDLAVLTACSGAGSIFGAFFISKQKGEIARLVSFIMMAMLGTAGSLLAILLLPSAKLLGVFIFLLSLLMTVIGAGSQILIQLSTPDSIRGRVMSLWIMLALGGPAIGAFLMGAVAEFIGFNLMLVIMLTLACVGGAWIRLKRKVT